MDTRADPLTVETLLRLLGGNREAILRVGAHPASVWIGAALVVSAAFARNYDQEDLLGEPWHLLVGAAAAIAVSFLLFWLVHGAARFKKSPSPRFFRGYRTFLGLFLCMAPMAWVYAIPYERFLEPYDAAVANLWTLAIVSVWRVVLTSRVLAVLFSTSALAMFFVVMLFADAVAILAPFVVETPIFDLMGGIQNSPVEALLGSVTFTIQVFGMLSLPVWSIGAICVLFAFRPSWIPGDPAPAAAPAPHLKLLVVVSLVVWLPVLPLTQPEQHLRRRAERLLESGQVELAAREMSRHSPGDYPLHWDPPPRPAYGERRPTARELCAALESPEVASWVRDVFLRKIEREVRRYGDPNESWSEFVGRVREYHERNRDSPLHADLDAAVECLLKHDRRLEPEDRAALESLGTGGGAGVTAGAGDQPERP